MPPAPSSRLAPSFAANRPAWRSGRRQRGAARPPRFSFQGTARLSLATILPIRPLSATACEGCAGRATLRNAPRADEREGLPVELQARAEHRGHDNCGKAERDGDKCKRQCIDHNISPILWPGLSGAFDGGSMPTHGCGRCDGHHRAVDCLCPTSGLRGLHRAASHRLDLAQGPKAGGRFHSGRARQGSRLIR
jgi:hypothetical protein